MDRDLFRPPQRTFLHEFSHLRGTHEKHGLRPMSTGDIFAEQEEVQHINATTRPKVKPVHDINDHRNDWAQRDDDLESRSKKEKVNSFIKKKESSWIIMGRKDRSPKERDEGVVGISPPSDGGKKTRFLARFKRQSS